MIFQQTWSSSWCRATWSINSQATTIINTLQIVPTIRVELAASLAKSAWLICRTTIWIVVGLSRNEAVWISLECTTSPNVSCVNFGFVWIWICIENKLCTVKFSFKYDKTVINGPSRSECKSYLFAHHHLIACVYCEWEKGLDKSQLLYCQLCQRIELNVKKAINCLC